jgi:hypothetical protein
MRRAWWLLKGLLIRTILGEPELLLSADRQSDPLNQSTLVAVKWPRIGYGVVWQCDCRIQATRNGCKWERVGRTDFRG